MKKLVILLLLCCCVAAQGELVNRYSFTDGDTAAVDSVGGRDGTLEGTATIAGNQLVLDGSGAVNLPADILDPALESVTIEAWFQISTVLNYQRLFDFGETSGGAGGNCIFYTPTSGDNNSRLAISTNGVPSWQTGEVRVDATIIDVDTTTHIACVYDGAVPELRLYQDGVLMGRTTVTSPHSLSNVARMYAYIGDAVYTADPYFNGTVDEFRIYNTALTDGEVLASFNAGPDLVMVKGSALNPNPANDNPDVCRDVVLSWTPGEYAATHDVYFGDNLDDVKDASRTNDPQGVLVGRNQDANTYGPNGPLEYGQTYYWRINEVNAPPDTTIYEGMIWSFTVEPFLYPIENITATASSSHNANMGPEKTIDDSGLNDSDQHSTTDVDMWLSSAAGPQPSWIKYGFDRTYKLHEMWVWNSNMAIESIAGLGMKEVLIEYSTNDVNWTQLEDVPEFARATGSNDYVHNTTVPFDGVSAKYVKITANSNWGEMPQYGLSEVRFLYKPVRARYPSPQDQITNVPPDVVLRWRAGREVATHDVYIDANEQAVIERTIAAESIPAGACEVSYAPSNLELDKTYYWKVVEVNNANTLASWESDVWSFSTVEYSLVEGFEDYNDYEPYRIFDTWVDGWGISENGSQVGYSTSPFAEQTVVHSGGQSMPFSYKNTGSAQYSETSRTFDSNQDWTMAGIKSLTLWIYGDSDNSAATLHVTVQDSSGTDKTVDHDNPNVVQQARWQQWDIDLTEFAGVNLSSVKKIFIGVGSVTTPQPGVSGLIYIDDIRLYPVSRQPVDPGDEAVEACYAFENNTQDGSGNGHDGTAFGEPSYVQGQSGYGMALEFDGTDDYVDLPIGSVISTLTDCTIATWANFYGDEGSFQRIFDFGTGTVVYMFLTPRVGDDGVMRFAITTGSYTAGAESILNAPATLATGWHHVAVVIDGSSRTMQLYLDGTIVASGPTETLPVDLGDTTQNWLGRSQWAADAYYSGSLDDFCIYSRALSELEVLYLAGNR